MKRLDEMEILAVCSLEETTPVAFMNVYQPGDIWIKIRGCEDCPMEARERCCGNCAFLMERGCAWHFEKGDNTRAKPFVCVVRPIPSDARSFCQLEYECVKGENKGKIRRVKDITDKVIDGPTES